MNRFEGVVGITAFSKQVVYVYNNSPEGMETTRCVGAHFRNVDPVQFER